MFLFIILITLTLYFFMTSSSYSFISSPSSFHLFHLFHPLLSLMILLCINCINIASTCLYPPIRIIDLKDDSLICYPYIYLLSAYQQGLGKKIKGYSIKNLFLYLWPTSSFFYSILETVQAKQRLFSYQSGSYNFSD